ncbi:gap-Pol polyprotein [Clonorchis sinensis]|uniref:Gap-Pol polyprotein n=1 Tax=Clonorchis sinensis TaxID=79923 RepID=H2KTL5_CLOSI|nr:gap-Pol polyprotein [Clonorchis sinensis]
MDEICNKNGEAHKDLETFQIHFDMLKLSKAGIISRKLTDSEVVPLVIPRVSRRKLIVKCNKMARKCAQRHTTYFCRAPTGPKGVVMGYVVFCKQCNLRRGGTRGKTYPVQHSPTAAIDEVSSFDDMGSFPLTTAGHQYIVMVAQHLPRWVEAAAVTNHQLTAISAVVVHHIVVNYRVPKIIVTDLGLCVKSGKFSSFF